MDPSDLQAAIALSIAKMKAKRELAQQQQASNPTSSTTNIPQSPTSASPTLADILKARRSKEDLPVSSLPAPQTQSPPTSAKNVWKPPPKDANLPLPINFKPPAVNSYKHAIEPVVWTPRNKVASNQNTPPNSTNIVPTNTSPQNTDTPPPTTQTFAYTDSGLEERRASHILIAIPLHSTWAQKRTARLKAEEIASIVKADPTHFNDYVLKYSEDQDTVREQGDLGYIAKGSMSPAFDTVLFGMKVGNVSDVVGTDFGFHIIKLVDIKTPEQAHPMNGSRKWQV